MMSVSYLDQLCDLYESNIMDVFVDAARAELARLRAAASEADALRAEVQAANERADLMSRTAHANAERARTGDEILVALRAERDELRAELNGARLLSSSPIIDALRSTVAEQARRIETAREIISHTIYGHPLFENSDGLKCGCSHCVEKRAWLAANAPTPAPEAEQDNVIKRMTDAHMALCNAIDALHFSGSVDGLGAVADARALWPTPEAERRMGVGVVVSKSAAPDLIIDETERTA